MNDLEYARRKRERLYRSVGIPKKDITLIVGGKVVDTKAKNEAINFVDDSKSILVLAGPPGCGKTTAASFALSRFIDNGIQQQRSGIFIDSPSIASVSRYKENEIQPFKETQFLVIDDLGTEYLDESGSFAVTLNMIFNRRYSEERKTLITTNVPFSKFSDRYGTRMVDRIRESGSFVEFNCASMRGPNA